VSNIEVFNELYGDFAVFADPNDATDIADKCRETFNNRHSIIKTMNDQQGSITNRFSYKKTALELYKLIKPLTF
jgi:hypothetical protein